MSDEILPEAFDFKEGPNGLEVSVNWLEKLSSNHAVAISEVRAAVGANLTVRASGRFAVLNVGRIASVMLESGRYLRVVQQPEEDDPSHSAICGIMANPLQVATDLAAMVLREGVLYDAR